MPAIIRKRDEATRFNCRAVLRQISQASSTYMGKATERSSSYVYLSGRFDGLPGDFVLTYDRPENHGGRGINYVSVEGEPEWVPAGKVPSFMKRIADEEEQLPELRRKWEEDKAKSAGVEGGTVSTERSRP